MGKSNCQRPTPSLQLLINPWSCSNKAAGMLPGWRMAIIFLKGQLPHSKWSLPPLILNRSSLNSLSSSNLNSSRFQMGMLPMRRFLHHSISHSSNSNSHPYLNKSNNTLEHTLSIKLIGRLFEGRGRNCCRGEEAQAEAEEGETEEAGGSDFIVLDS